MLKVIMIQYFSWVLRRMNTIKGYNYGDFPTLLVEEYFRCYVHYFRYKRETEQNNRRSVS